MTIVRALADESVLVLALVSAVAVALDLPEQWQNVVAAAVPLVLALLVRSITTKPSSVAEAVETAAMRTATILTHDTVGVAGSVSDRGGKIVGGVIDSTLDKVGGLVPSLTGRGK